MSETDRATKQQEAEHRAQRKANLERYLAACTALSNAVVEHAGDFLVFRAEQIATLARRPLGAAATAIVAAQAVPLRVALAEGLGRVDWLPHAAYFRNHEPGAQPSELRPLAELVDASLSPLRTEFGQPLHPPSAFPHQPLASESWPGTVAGMETIRYGEREGFPMRMERPCRKQHPIHRAFNAVSEAAIWIDRVDVRAAEAQKEKVRV